MKAVTAAQMRRLEQAAVEAGVSLDELMENAGRAVGDEVAARLGKAAGSRVVVLVGPGNNGGDGLVAATRLAQLGAAVEAFVVAGSGDPAGKRPAAEAAGVRVGTAMDESGIRSPEPRGGIGRCGHRCSVGYRSEPSDWRPSRQGIGCRSAERVYRWSQWICRQA